MARRSSSRSSRPMWLIVVAAVVGWVYNNYLKPPAQSKRTNTTRPRNTPKPRSRSGSNSSASKRGTVTAQGGVPFRDHVSRVIDGDTVKLAGQGSIRLIGVDCPEKSQLGGSEATAFTAKYLADQDVEVELCAQQPTDRYGRGLGLIYLRQNGRRILFNAELVRQGYARVYSLRPCTVDEEQWNNFYEEARHQNRGLFRTLGEVPDAASYRRRKRSSLRGDEFERLALEFALEMTLQVLAVYRSALKMRTCTKAASSVWRLSKPNSNTGEIEYEDQNYGVQRSFAGAAGSREPCCR